ncbi:hypothetical protein DFH09DRAFT_1088065 [Mycena vulgaris]|nr:hypothetical protein DFH09DRAFT_1088065 [Mycena vulgaris]
MSSCMLGSMLGSCGRGFDLMHKNFQVLTAVQLIGVENPQILYREMGDFAHSSQESAKTMALKSKSPEGSATENGRANVSRSESGDRGPQVVTSMMHVGSVEGKIPKIVGLRLPGAQDFQGFSAATPAEGVIRSQPKEKNNINILCVGRQKVNSIADLK